MGHACDHGMMGVLTSRATLLDPGGIKYRCYPGPADFRPTDNDTAYLSTLRSSNEDLVPTPLTLAILLHDGTSADSAAQRSAMYALISKFGELLDTDRALHQLKVIISTYPDLQRRHIMDLMKTINDAFVLGLRGNRRSELILQFSEDWQDSCIEQFINSGFDRVWLRLSADQAFRLGPRQLLARLQSYGFQRIAMEIIDIQDHPNARLMFELRAAHPAHISFWSDMLMNSDFVYPEFQDALIADGYRAIGISEFVDVDDELVGEPVYYTSFGLSTIEEGDRIAIGPSGISKIEDHYFQLAADIDRFRNIANQGGLPVSAEFESTLDDCIRRQAIHQLLADGKLNLARIQHRLDLDLTCYLRQEMAKVATILGTGAVSNSGSFVVPPDLHHRLHEICQVFDRYPASKCVEL
jgi:hypothetical protein